MSMYRGHLLGGLAAYLCVIIFAGLSMRVLEHNLYGLLATLAGSLFPDIDIRSKGQRLFLKLIFLGVALALLLQSAFVLVVLLSFSVLPIIFPHRGLFHDTLFVGILIGCVAGLLTVVMPEKHSYILSLAGFFFVGVLSHLVLDKGVLKTFYLR